MQTFSLLQIQYTVIAVFSSIVDNSLSVVFIEAGLPTKISLSKPATMSSDFISKIVCQVMSVGDNKSGFRCMF